MVLDCDQGAHRRRCQPGAQSLGSMGTLHNPTAFVLKYRTLLEQKVKNQTTGLGSVGLQRLWRGVTFPGSHPSSSPALCGP